MYIGNTANIVICDVKIRLWQTSRDERAQAPLSAFRTASDERAGPGNEAKLAVL